MGDAANPPYRSLNTRSNESARASLDSLETSRALGCVAVKGAPEPTSNVYLAMDGHVIKESFSVYAS